MIKTAPSRYRAPATVGPKRLAGNTPVGNISASIHASGPNNAPLNNKPHSYTQIVTILPEPSSSSSQFEQPPSQQRSELSPPPPQSSPPRTMPTNNEPTPSQRLDMMVPPPEPQLLPQDEVTPPQQISRKKSLKNLLKRAHTTRVSSKDKDSSNNSSNGGINKRTPIPEGYRLVDIRLPTGTKTQQPVNEAWTVQNLISATLLANPTHVQSRGLDADDYMVWEVCASLKLRRALRSKELVSHILATWPLGECDWYLELDDAERRLDIGSVASLCPRRDIVSAAAAGAAGSDEGALEYKCIAMQRGSRLQRWRKVGISVHNHELTLTELSSANTSTASSPRRYLDLRELDIYEVAAGSSSANTPYLIGLRVQRNPNSFMDPKRDCVHVLSFPPENFNPAEDPAVKAYNTIRNIAFSLRSAEVDQLVKKARLASAASAHRSKSVSAASGRGRPRAASTSAGTAAPIPMMPPAPLIESVTPFNSGHPTAAATTTNPTLFKPNSLLNRA
ncbi:hypothetical protein D0Z00_001295 [Geotrichum galactomycetum]|uniref:Uncharacterized protein n=1 Tax=Geotrichum galactomycetum TaxID=27317 RepID=A0ACB6V7B3_9ASCO|nr:hypothetical protein D0Z00_001295 [Geotrichum candidum]